MSEFRCYFGTSDFSGLVHCSSVAGTNGCMRITSYGYTSYTCSIKLRSDSLAAQENVYSTPNGVNACICDTEGCDLDPYVM